MNSVEQALLILNNSQLGRFKMARDNMRRALFAALKRGFAVNTYPVTITKTYANGVPESMVYTDGRGFVTPAHNDLSMSLFNAGLRINDFGDLFLSQNRLSFSHGSALFANLIDTMRGTIRLEEGFSAASSYPLEATAVEIMRRLIIEYKDSQNTELNASKKVA